MTHSGAGIVHRLRICLLLLFLPQFLQLGKNLIRPLLRLADNALGFRLTLAAGILLGPFHLFAEGAGLAGVLLPAAPQAFGFILRLFQALALFLQLRQHILKADRFAVHLRLGVLNNALVQPQTAGNRKGIGLAGNTDQQAVGGPQRGHIELAGGILHPCRGHGKGFQLRIMGGCCRQGALAAGILDNGDGQRRTLHRVCSGAQLVE